MTAPFPCERREICLRDICFRGMIGWGRDRYFVTLDVRQEQVPWLVEPSTPGDTSGQRIMCKVERHYIFTVEFPRPIIRRGG